MLLVALNLPADDHKVPVPHFSVDRGHYSTPFELRITAPAPGWKLVLTTDGSEPSLSPLNGQEIIAANPGEAAIWSTRITTTSSIRAVAVDPESGQSASVTHSYVFPEAALRQGAPKDHTAEWGHSGPDWEVDPDIVNHRDPESRLVAGDLMDIPALYISLPFAELWGEDGIYIAGESEPRECSVEMLNPAGDSQKPNQIPGFQHDGTIQVTGGSSTQRWKTDKLSLRLKFHHEAKFPVFAHAGSLPGRVPPAKFHTLVLDARLNESWVHASSEQREHGQYTRDQFVADLENRAGGNAPHGRHVHLYLAGVYWGLYNLHERPDEYFAADYLGGSHDDYDVIKHQWNDVVSGDSTRFLELRDLIDQPDVASAGAFERISGLLDLEDFSRYMLVNYWAGNTDWSHQNWYASFNRGDPAGRWRFHSWDAEHSLKDPRENVTAKDDPDSPTHFHRQLIKNPQYRAIFNRTVKAAIKPGGVLDKQQLISAYQDRLAEIDQAVRAESARWGDNRTWRPYTRGKDWVSERDRILKEYLPTRTGIVLKQMQEVGWID